MIIKLKDSGGYIALVNMKNVTSIQEYPNHVSIKFIDGSIASYINKIEEISNQLCKKTT